MRRLTLAAILVLLAACGGGGATVTMDQSGPADITADGASDLAAPDAAADLPEPEDTFELRLPETAEETVEPGCQPGDGCFLDPCTSNEECQSGWCVEHMGEGVCTQLCQEECPPGWTCRQVGTGPDISYICVSGVANLCRPCAMGADCKSPGGSEDVCVDYGPNGSFCGGACLSNEDCPWGFSCGEAITVEGTSTFQCIAETGSCPCTAKSIALGLSTPCEVENEFGVCTGTRVCTDSGLTECDAAAPSIEVCNGLDDDCDGDEDEGEFVEGEYVGLCDDGNDCTKDSCLGEAGCDHAALSEGECGDGNPCTVADHCEAGICVGQLVDCDDGNPCTDDWCNPAGGCAHGNSNEECSDGDPCTLGDHCVEGACTGEPVACDCLADADCDALEDGNLCNGTLFCDKSALPYECAVKPGTTQTCPEPTGANAACLAAFCDPATAACSLVPANEGKLCDDGNACTIGDTCGGGVCGGGAPANCNDGNPCTTDTCNPAEGCIHGNSNGGCSDGDVCTTDDVCVAGSCVAGPPLDCNDGNPCTADSCDVKKGCIHAPANGVCDDSNPCTEGDHCAGGLCVASAYLSCDDANPCTKDSCTPGAGCVHEAVAGSCDDGNPCTVNDTCVGGVCVPGPGQSCDDSNPCTDDTCDESGACIHTANAAPCDDGNACTLNDQCNKGKCAAGVTLDCDDDDVCTTDSCTPGIGCVHTLNTAPCNDGDVCTTGDHCHLGECIHSGTLACNDANPCTVDTCHPENGCQYLPADGPCDDGNPCTEGDTCQGGQCVGGGNPDCDDDNPCTNDQCHPQLGCQHTFNTAPCDDGSVCTTGDKCANGICTPAGTLSCNDANPCTDDSCDPQDGCLHTPNQANCPGGHCEAGECIQDCVPSCAGKACGDDGCGGSCGSCEETPNAVCTQNNTCAVLPCSSDITCLPHGLVCDVGAGHCVQCIQNGECLFLFGQNKPFCDPEYDLCAECLTDGDCVDTVCNRGFVPAQCEPEGAFDVGEPCSDISHCIEGLLCDVDNTCESLCGTDCKPGVCNGDTGLCVDCHQHGDCPDDKVCVNKACIPGTQCGGNGDCPAQTPVCLSGMCVECSVNADCEAGQKCGTDKQCHTACVSSLACAGQVCNLAKGYCVSCVLDLDCQAQGKARCDSSLGVCVDCVTDDHCAAGQFCSQGICEADACVPGVTYFCISGKQRLCNAAGSGYEPLACAEACCPEGQMCVNGECSEWAPTGWSADMAGYSCKQILTGGYSKGDGKYWIKPDGYNGDPFQVHCDMTTDGGGWTLVAWTGSSSAQPRGVPYPGLAYCANLNCLRGSGAPQNAMVHLLRAGTEFAKTQQTQTMGSYGTNILAYAYSGKYPYGAALKNLTLTYGPGTCSTQLATCQFVNLKGTAENNGKTVYLAQGLFYSGYTYQEGQEYIWHIGVPDEKCSGNGQMPGTWMGTWSDGQYGPKESSSTGAHSVWIR